MVLTNSRILSCEVWLILMRKTSAPASNRRRIMALSEDAGPSVARILIRRRRLMACFRAPQPVLTCPVAEQACPEPRVGWAGRVLLRLAPCPGFRPVCSGQPFPADPAP